LKLLSSLRGGEWIVLGGSALIAAFAALVGVMLYLKPMPTRFGYAPSPLAAQGEAIYRREACGSCHRVLGNGPNYGPGLDGVGTRRSAAWLKEYLINPRSGVGDRPYRLVMPSSRHLSDADLTALVAHLLALRSGPLANLGALPAARNDAQPQ
jgi:cbb3-type cytochrome oxidase cytochrome c subunit